MRLLDVCTIVVLIQNVRLQYFEEVYVSSPGYALRQAGLESTMVIKSVGGVPTPNLDSLIE